MTRGGGSAPVLLRLINVSFRACFVALSSVVSYTDSAAHAWSQLLQNAFGINLIWPLTDL